MRPFVFTMFALLLLTGNWSIANEPAAPDIKDPPTETVTAADSIIQSLKDPDLQRLVIDVLDRNPRLAVVTAKARASDQRAPQVSSLPDPMASLTLFLLQPQTRVGPQKASAGISQRLPWFGKLKLKEQMALLEAAASWTRIESRRLKLVSKVRQLYLELQFLDRERHIVSEDQTTLEHYEELAQARYASGVGIGQTAIKIQAEITRARARLIDILKRRASLIAEINTLRDRPAGTPVMLARISHPLPAAAGDAPHPATFSRIGVLDGLSSTTARPSGRKPHWPQHLPALATKPGEICGLGVSPPTINTLPPFDKIRESALDSRPELAEAQALIDMATIRVDLSQKDNRPDFTVGLNYALVGKRDDSAGQLNPPEGNGDDILGLSGGINLPIWRSKNAAGVEEAVQQQLAAEQARRLITAEIDGDLADLNRRVPLIQEQLDLFDQVLTVQCEESLRSAETAYASGTASALDLLDAERVLLGVRIAAERARTDLKIAIANLEGVLAAPLETIDQNGSAS